MTKDELFQEAWIAEWKEEAYHAGDLATGMSWKTYEDALEKGPDYVNFRKTHRAELMLLKGQLSVLEHIQAVSYTSHFIVNETLASCFTTDEILDLIGDRAVQLATCIDKEMDEGYIRVMKIIKLDPKEFALIKEYEEHIAEKRNKKERAEKLRQFEQLKKELFNEST